MKRTIIPVTLLLIAALALTGCFGAATPAAPTAGPSGSTSTAVVSTTPAVSQTGTAGMTTPAATSAATGAATAAATAGATSIPNTGGTAAPTSAATTAANTPAATSAATTAATAAVPTTAATMAATTAATPPASTGQTSTPVVVLPGQPGQYVRLSILLQSTLSTTMQSGKVTGVVIAQPNATVNAGTPTPTPDKLVPYVRYAVVSMNGANGATSETIIPWELFTFNSSGTSQTFSLKGSASGLANAPVVSLPSQSGVLASGWDNAQTQYWTSQGIAVPVTGAATQPETDVLVRNTLNGTNVVDTKNQVLGSMTDILVDSTTGQFTYAVFSGGQLFGNRTFVVPVKNLIFQFQNLGAGVSGLGNVQLNFSPDVLKNAPSFNGINLIPLDPATLTNLLNQFWQSVPSNR